MGHLLLANMKKFTKLSSNVSAHKQQLINHATECIKPAITYFNQKFECDLKPIVSAFKYARYFDPTKIMKLKPCSTDIDNMKVFHFLIDHIARRLKKRTSELSMQLPHWSTACKLILLVLPSSAAAERVFLKF